MKLYKVWSTGMDAGNAQYVAAKDISTIEKDLAKGKSSIIKVIEVTNLLTILE